MFPVTQRSGNKADRFTCVLLQCTVKKLDLTRNRWAIFWLRIRTLNPILRLVILKNPRLKTKNNKPQQKLGYRLQQVVNYRPGDRLKEGTQIFILLSVQKKV